VRLRAEEPLLLRDVLLEDVGLQRPVESAEVDALAFRGDEVPSNRVAMSAALSMATPQ
jgi:hypothetical protein